MELNTPTAAYLHIPFCRRRCFYCDFPISVVGDTRNGSNSGTIAQYVEALCQEICTSPNFGAPLKTVFFGGGTPSLLSVAQLNQILHTLDQQFGIASDAELSIEIDPGTFDRAHLEGYKAAGMNRLSLGVQAFQSDLLEACGRSHRVEDVYESIALIQQAGIANFSLDLISGLPNHTLEQWHDSLKRAIALSPTHLSVYDLTIEPMTPFGKRYQPGTTPLPSDELTADMYRAAHQVLTDAGYAHYEVSNYAKPGYQCRHNRVYWENKPFYGFGMGATSYLNGDRVARPRKTKAYYEWLNTRSIDSWTPPQPLSDRFLDTLMTGLRLAEGLDLQQLRAEFGRSRVEQLWKCVQQYEPSGWIEIVDSQHRSSNLDPLPEQGRIRLTNPEGFLFSNVILVRLFETFDEN